MENRVPLPSPIKKILLKTLSPLPSLLPLSFLPQRPLHHRPPLPLSASASSSTTPNSTASSTTPPSTSSTRSSTGPASVRRHASDAMHFLRRLPQRPPDHRQSLSPLRFRHFIDDSRLCGEFNDSALNFQRKILEWSGDMLFNNTSVKPKAVGILVINCSLFNPTLSLSAIIVNRYKLKGNIRSFNLEGMGIRNWYFENKKSMLIPNCLFRVSGVPVQGPDEEGASDLADYDLIR